MNITRMTHTAHPGGLDHLALVGVSTPGTLKFLYFVTSLQTPKSLVTVCQMINEKSFSVYVKTLCNLSTTWTRPCCGCHGVMY